VPAVVLTAFGAVVGATAIVIGSAATISARDSQRAIRAPPPPPDAEEIDDPDVVCARPFAPAPPAPQHTISKRLPSGISATVVHVVDDVNTVRDR
jgi:hypothetical protein